jgi:hypothetical protein
MMVSVYIKSWRINRFIASGFCELKGTRLAVAPFPADGQYTIYKSILFIDWRSGHSHLTELIRPNLNSTETIDNVHR